MSNVSQMRPRARAALSLDELIDAVAEALKDLISVIRRDEIRGTNDGEIDHYVVLAIRSRARDPRTAQRAAPKRLTARNGPEVTSSRRTPVLLSRFR